jgi:hypothetical protein
MRKVKASRRRGRSLFVSALALLILFQMSAPAWAWGRLGHRVIARMAEKKLTPKAKAAIAALLDEGETIADASTWADENRGRLPKTVSPGTTWMFRWTSRDTTRSFLAMFQARDASSTRSMSSRRP